MPTHLAVWTCAALALGASATQQATWLPQPVADSTTRLLAARLEVVPEMLANDAGTPEAQRLAMAKQSVTAMTAVVTNWGVEGTLARAPQLSAVKIGPTDNPYLNAMARFQICNALLYVQIETGVAQSFDHRATAVVGATGLSLAIISLREPLVAGGNPATDMQEHLSGPMLEPAIQALQTDTQTQNRVAAECQPIIAELVTQTPMFR